MEIFNQQHVRMLSSEVFDRLHELYYRTHFVHSGCLLTDEDSGPMGMEPPIIPYAPFSRTRVFYGNRVTGSYNHHPQLIKLNGRYHLAFSNGYRDEVAGGQRVMVASSYDAITWDTPVCVVGGESGTTVSYTCAGMYTDGQSIYVIVRHDDTIPDPEWIGGRRIVSESARLDVYVSNDGNSWKMVYSYGDTFRGLYEGPRLTAEGLAICSCSQRQEKSSVLIWPGDDILNDPHSIEVGLPEGASFEYGQASWYQLPEGRIVAFWRDEAASCHVFVNWSDDGGRSFTVPVISDIPDSMGRVYAGRLLDGRYYLCANAFPSPLNRRRLMLLLSNDGITFGQVYTLIDDPTSQRRKGLLKVDGYQYPCCLAEKGRLIVAYSVNKEDIECGIVDTSVI